MIKKFISLTLLYTVLICSLPVICTAEPPDEYLIYDITFDIFQSVIITDPHTETFIEKKLGRYDGFFSTFDDVRFKPAVTAAPSRESLMYDIDYICSESQLRIVIDSNKNMGIFNQDGDYFTAINDKTCFMIVRIFDYYFKYGSPKFHTADGLEVPPNQAIPECDEWAAGEVAAAAENQLIPDFFDLDSHLPIRRGDFSKLIQRLFTALLSADATDKLFIAEAKSDYLYTSGAAPVLSDVEDISIFALNGMEIITSRQHGVSDSDEPITRADAAMCIKQLLSYFNMSMKGYTRLDDAVVFVDAEDISAIAADGVLFAQSAGIMRGNADACFLPDDDLSVQEAYIIMQRIYEYFKADSAYHTSLTEKYQITFETAFNGNLAHSEECNIYIIMYMPNETLEDFKENVEIISFTIGGIDRLQYTASDSKPHGPAWKADYHIQAITSQMRSFGKTYVRGDVRVKLSDGGTVETLTFTIMFKLYDGLSF